MPHRGDVLFWYRLARERGLRATVNKVVTGPGRILVGTSVSATRCCRFQTATFRAADGVRFDSVDLGGVPAVHNRTTLPGEESPVLLHFHGGGYLMGSASAARGLTSRLAAAVGGDVFAVDYRRAPESPFPAAVEDAVTAYRGLLDSGISASRMYITGESSGGGLGVVLALRLRDLSLPQPAGIVAMSPMTDMAITGQSIDETAGQDPVGLSIGPSTRILLTQMSAYYMQGHDSKDPLASPIFGSLNGLPPMLVQVARNEALFSDAERLVKAAERDGVDVKLSAYEDSVHVFPMFDFLPEAEEAIKEVCAFVGR